MDALVADAPVLQSAKVTLDVLHTGVAWGWYVTMNMWAKSVGTGVLLVGAYMVQRHARSRAFYRLWMPPVAMAFIGLTLLFTVLDLHQVFRFWHLFVWPHFTSAIPIGAWTLSAYSGVLALMLLALWKKDEGLYDRLFVPAVVLAFFATIYTAGLLGQANARELWSAPTELAQVLAAAGLAGAASFLLLKAPTPEEQRTLGWILALSALLSLSIFLAEVVLAPQKSEEAEYVVHTLTTGHLGVLFWSGLGLGFAVPLVLGLWSAHAGKPVALRLAAIAGLAGLWMVKHAWLVAPQLLPLS